MINCILIDLDGTICDSEEGITKSVQYALKFFNIEVKDLSTLRKHIGPPLKEGFREFWNMSEEDALYAIGKYRERYSVTGVLENKLYVGIKELLQQLESSGKQVILATSKPEFYAKQIIEHFDLTKYFADICGSGMDGSRSTKGEVIDYALKKNKLNNLNEMIMVGDRLHDIEGAKENGLPSIGVLYGFGTREELETVGADYIAETVEELGSLLLN